ncbi:MAG: glutathione S-transferase family protein, partial [Rhodocyclaceae bacterium]|nr:glutathione S-transferase family protein [Rhodocyclaceae bacterium]
LPYAVHPVNITADEQFHPDFLAVSPNNKIPALVDSDGPGGKPISLFESGAILVYLAEKTASPLLPAAGAARYQALVWLMFQMGGVGPMFGQAHHFRRFAKEQVPYATKRYTEETHRLYEVMDTRLADNAHLAGEHYTVADVATYPWVARFEWHGIDWNDLPNVKRWFDQVGAREAVKKGMAVP